MGSVKYVEHEERVGGAAAAAGGGSVVEMSVARVRVVHEMPEVGKEGSSA